MEAVPYGPLPTNTIECHDEGALLLVRGSKRRGSCVRSPAPSQQLFDESRVRKKQDKPKNDREMRSWCVVWPV